MTEAEQHLIDVAVLMAQELQEYVDVAIDCAGSNSAELATQELLNDWEAAYAACGFHDDDERFAGLRRAIAAEEGFCNYQVGHQIEVEQGEFREYIGGGAEGAA